MGVLIGANGERASIWLPFKHFTRSLALILAQRSYHVYHQPKRGKSLGGWVSSVTQENGAALKSWCCALEGIIPKISPTTPKTQVALRGHAGSHEAYFVGLGGLLKKRICSTESNLHTSHLAFSGRNKHALFAHCCQNGRGRLQNYPGFAQPAPTQRF